MATEIRRLIFSHSESVVAIRNYGIKHGVLFPDGRIIKARFAGSTESDSISMKRFRAPIQDDYNVKTSNKTVMLAFFDENTLEQKFYNLTSDFISSALIEYCIANKIMLPKLAEKSLDLTDFNICMDINLETETRESRQVESFSLDE